MIVFDRKDPKTLIQDYFCPKTENEKMPFFDQNHRLTPLENLEKCNYLK